MEEIKTPKDLAKMILNNHSVSRDGMTYADFYSYSLREGHIEKEHFISLVTSAINNSLELFPEYPQFINFLQWVQKSQIDTLEFYNKLFVFLNEKWTEEACPDRIFERFFVIEHLVARTHYLSSFEWVENTSAKALAKYPWKKHDILYGMSKDKGAFLREINPTLLEDQKSFFQTILLRIPAYLKDIPKKDLSDIFSSHQALEEGVREKILK